MTWHKVTGYVAHDITAISSKAISLRLYLPQVILVIKVIKTIEGAGKRINSLKISNYSSHNLRPVFHETHIIPASKCLVWENQNWSPQASFKEKGEMSECMITEVSHRIQRQEVWLSLPKDRNWEERGLVPSLCLSLFRQSSFALPLQDTASHPSLTSQVHIPRKEKL